MEDPEDKLSLDEFEAFAAQSAAAKTEEDSTTPNVTQEGEKQPDGPTQAEIDGATRAEIAGTADVIIGLSSAVIALVFDRVDKSKGWKKRNNALTTAEKAALKTPLMAVVAKYIGKTTPEAQLLFVVGGIIVLRLTNKGEPKDGDVKPTAKAPKDKIEKALDMADAPYGRRKDGTPKQKPGRKK